MGSLSRRRFLCGAAGSVLTACRGHRAGSARGVAFSLAVAEKILRRGGVAGPEVATLAGIRSIVGLVYDAGSRDAVVVGKTAAGGEPILLDDLVAAIRSRVVHKEWPMVSIERTPDTDRTGIQEVQFRGGVAGSRMGARLLGADLALKNAALGLPAGARWQIPSYFERCAKRMAEAELGKATSRFWFYAEDASLLERDNVFVLRNLNIGVEAVGVNGGAERDDIADSFAADFSQHYREIAEENVAVARLKPIYDLVAIGTGMESLPDAVSSYWTREYPTQGAETPKEYPLVKRREEISGRGGVQLELSGGVDTRIFTRRLRDGDCQAFRDAVLKTRPSGDTLSWKVPIGMWFDQSGPLSAGDADLLAKVPGTVIRRDLLTVPQMPIDRGGVSLDIPVPGAMKGGVSLGSPDDFHNVPDSPRASVPAATSAKSTNARKTTR